MLISIIVPIYKVENYIRQCVDSILNQTYTDIEVILVDDGSPDNSGSICDEYSEKDKRIKVIHKENGGPSDARNEGLKIAKGEYIAFMDGDDFYYNNEVITKIVETISESHTDIIFLPAILYYEERQKYVYVDKKYKRSKLAYEKKKNAIEYALKYDFFKACPWDKVVKRSIINDNNILFLKGLSCEDIDWTANLLIHSRTYDCIEAPIYAYRQRMSSRSHTVEFKHLKDILYQIDKWKGYQGVDKELMYGYLAHNYVMLMETYTKVNSADKKAYQAQIKKLAWLLRYDYSLNVHKVKLVYRFMGFDLTRFILKLCR